MKEHRTHFMALCTGLLLVLMMCVQSCSYEADRTTRERVDSLCLAAYRMRYVDLDSTERLAMEALKLAGEDQGLRCEALNELTFVRYVQMDFAGAFALLDTIRETSRNQLDLLCGDVMRLKICQRINDGRQYFDTRNRIENRLRRIHQEERELNYSEKQILQYAESEYHIVNSTYFFYQNQDSAARAEIAVVADLLEGTRDTAQWLSCQYMYGSGGMLEGDMQSVTIEEFDDLFEGYLTSRKVQNQYFVGNNLQALASLLLDSVKLSFIRNQRPEGLSIITTQHLSWLPDTVDSYDKDIPRHLPEAVALHALKAFQEYGDSFQCACVYRSLGEINFRHAHYDHALKLFQNALDIISTYHSQYYANPDLAPRLTLYSEEADNNISQEKRWIETDSILSLPDWMAGIRQQISLTFSALHDKGASAYNRHIYLDILNSGDEDDELLSLSDDLARQITRLRWTLIGLVLLVLAVGYLMFRYARYLRKDTLHQMHLRQRILEACTKLTDASSLEELKTSNHMPELLQLVQPYVQFIQRNADQLARMDDTLEGIEEQRALVQHQLVKNKEQNAERRAKVSMVYAVMPFLDRIIGEVDRMKRSGEPEAHRLEYIGELTDQIMAYNAILTSWIQMSQGQLSLQITTVQLEPIFATIQRGHYAYDQAGVELCVSPTKAQVKGDQALTLFMINTLADNARKFTPEGGRVSIEAKEEAEYVEVSVTDTGCGLNVDDVDTLNNSKVYDPTKIGLDATRGKGFGFGLMNCRGIIEKYRKTSALFSVCRFGVESEKGSGSRFYFRLPRVLTIVAVLMMGVSVGMAQDVDRSVYELYDSACVANDEDRYEDALYDAALAIEGLASGFTAYPEDAEGREGWSETECYQRGLKYDYEILAALHNEAAISALALNDWELYEFNNGIYTHLKRLMAQDKGLPEKCEKLIQARSDSRLAILFVIVFVVVALLLAYSLLRRRLHLGVDLRQLGEINDSLLAVEEPSEDAESLQPYADALLHRLYVGLTQLYHLKGMCLTITDPHGTTLCTSSVGLNDASASGYALTLQQSEGEELSVGELRVNGDLPKDVSLLRLAFSFFTLVIYNAVVRTTQQVALIEQMEDERNQMRYEDNRLHVQNQVLDNCLSTIKHESMYYPARIQQLAQRLIESPNKEDLLQLHELSHYYKDVYSLLSLQADRQVALNGFRATRCQVELITQSVKASFKRLTRRAEAGYELNIEALSPENDADGLMVLADADLLRYMLDKLVEGILQMLPRGGELNLAVSNEGRFVVVRFTLPHLALSAEECHSLFMPQKDNICFLIVKQILREHDAMTNHPGLRMVAEQKDIWFTLVKTPSNSPHGGGL